MSSKLLLAKMGVLGLAATQVTQDEWADRVRIEREPRDAARAGLIGFAPEIEESGISGFADMGVVEVGGLEVGGFEVGSLEVGGVEVGGLEKRDRALLGGAVGIGILTAGGGATGGGADDDDE